MKNTNKIKFAILKVMNNSTKFKNPGLMLNLLEKKLINEETK